MVQQDVYLFDGTIKDNIAYGKPGATDDEIIKSRQNVQVSMILSWSFPMDTTLM